MDNLEELRGGRTGKYRRDIAHFLGAWLPDNPGETRTGQRRIWIAASIYREGVDLSYRTRAGFDRNGGNFLWWFSQAGQPLQAIFLPA